MRITGPPGLFASNHAGFDSSGNAKDITCFPEVCPMEAQLSASTIRLDSGEALTQRGIDLRPIKFFSRRHPFEILQLPLQRGPLATSLPPAKSRPQTHTLRLLDATKGFLSGTPKSNIGTALDPLSFPQGT
jgi:hypothetical protein